MVLVGMMNNCSSMNVTHRGSKLQTRAKVRICGAAYGCITSYFGANFIRDEGRQRNQNE